MRDQAWLACLVGLGCAAGAVSRWTVDRTLTTLLPGSFTWGPVAWGPVVVNILGSLILGGLVALLLDGSGARPIAAGGIAGSSVWLVLAVGYCGGLTTMSALTTQAALLMERRHWRSALGLVGVTTIGSLIGFSLGWVLIGL